MRARKGVKGNDQFMGQTADDWIALVKHINNKMLQLFQNYLYNCSV